MLKRDQLFSSPINHLGNWTFDERVAEVFPDMIHRSIPGYSHVIKMIGMITKRFAQPYSQLYDLGCALGEASLSIQRNINVRGCKIIAIDNSPAMIERCRCCIDAFRTDTQIEVREANILDIPIENASVIVLNFTLQFLNPSDRFRLLSKIYHGLRFNGILIISEKFSFQDTSVSEFLFSMHHDFKITSGYSELEITQKRRMLETVMLTDSIETHKKRLKLAGFEHVEMCLQYFNFGSLIALKKSTGIHD